jgi:hypothetical protein
VSAALNQALELLSYLDQYETGQLLSRLVLTAGMIEVPLEVPADVEVEDLPPYSWASCWERGLARIAEEGQTALSDYRDRPV